MTDEMGRLAELSAKATPGPYKGEFSEKSGTVSVLGRLGDGNVRALDGYGFIAQFDCATRETVDHVMFPAIDPEKLATAHFLIALENAYRAGRLVPATPTQIEAIVDAAKLLVSAMETDDDLTINADVDTALARLGSLLRATPAPPAVEPRFKRGATGDELCRAEDAGWQRWKSEAEAALIKKDPK